MIRCEYPYFYLDNGEVSLILSVLENGHPAQVYFGRSLGEISEEDCRYMSLRAQKAAGTVKYTAGRSFTLADQTSELPVYGTTSFQSGAIELAFLKDHAPLYPDLKLKDWAVSQGKENLCPAPCTRPHPGAQTLTLRLQDEEFGIEVELFYTLYPHSGVLVRSNRITNRSSEPILLERLMSGALYLPDENWDFIHLNGNWARERQVVRQPLSVGGAFSESLSGSSSHQCNPYAAFVQKGAADDEGEAFGSNLVYSSSFLNQVSVNEFGFLRFLCGIHPQTFEWKLDPGTSFDSPEALFAWSGEGLDGLSRVYSRFIRSHLLPPRFARSRRPICLNSWESVYFDFDESKLLELAQVGAKAGMECFVLDDGWFGRRDAANASLGDWVPDPRKFPSGLDVFAEKVRDLGMEFGIWFEPEMVNPDSDLYRRHPEYVVRPPRGRYSIGRDQWVLDFASPEVVDAVYAQMREVLASTKASYIKWDMNRSITEAWSNWLERMERPQNEFFHRYIRGVYSLYEKIQADFPEILIEGCAGGGGRFDLGILYYSPQIWVSDNTDGLDRLKIQYGTSLAYPLSTLSNHISEIPNHQTCRCIPMKFRQDVAFFGILGYELDLRKLSDQELAQIREQIAEYRKMEDSVLNGDLWHLKSPFSSADSAWALQGDQSVHVGCYSDRADLSGRVYDLLPLPFADKKNWTLGGTRLSGSVLSSFGLRFPTKNNGTGSLNGKNASGFEAETFSGDYQSSILLLQEVRD